MWTHLGACESIRFVTSSFTEFIQWKLINYYWNEICCDVISFIYAHNYIQLFSSCSRGFSRKLSFYCERRRRRERLVFWLQITSISHLGDVACCSVGFHSFCTELIYDFIRFFFSLSFWLVRFGWCIITNSHFPCTNVVCGWPEKKIVFTYSILGVSISGNEKQSNYSNFGRYYLRLRKRINFQFVFTLIIIYPTAFSAKSIVRWMDKALKFIVKLVHWSVMVSVIKIITIIRNKYNDK